MRLASKLAAALAVFFCCLSGFGQAAPISGQAVDQNGAPIPFAQVRVCSVTSSGTPCTPTTLIYYDYNFHNVAPNPYTTDQYGNYTVYAPALAAPNLYVVQLVPASGVTWTYVENGPYCSLSGCTFTGPITAPYFNATQSPYYEVNGVQLASTNLLDTANIAYLDHANVFTGGKQTSAIWDAGTGFEIGNAAASNHVLLGNGTNYVDSATIPYSIISGGSGAGPFSGTSVPCPSNNFSSANCTSAQIVAALNNSPTTQLAGALIPAVLLAPTTSSQIVNFSVNTSSLLLLSNPNAGASASAGIGISNGTDFGVLGINGTGEANPGDIGFIASHVGAQMHFEVTTGSIAFESDGDSPPALLLDSSNNATFGGDVTVDGLSSGAGNCVQAGDAGILTTISTPCAVVPITQQTEINTLNSCNYPDDGANEACTNTVTMGAAMADTGYTVSCTEYTNPSMGTVVLSNTGVPTIISTTQYSFQVRTQGSSSEWTTYPNYGKSFVCTAYHP